MQFEEFASNFVEQFESVETALVEARDELNESRNQLDATERPEGLRPLRLTLHEVGNILVQVISFSGNPDADPSDPEEAAYRAYLQESFDELSEELFLKQFPDTHWEATDEFHADLVTLIRFNPDLMQPLSKLVRLMKGRPDTRLSVSRKFETLGKAAENVLEALDDSLPDYVYRVLAELCDFSDCMDTVERSEDSEPKSWIADNDNGVATMVGGPKPV